MSIQKLPGRAIIGTPSYGNEIFDSAPLTALVSQLTNSARGKLQQREVSVAKHSNSQLSICLGTHDGQYLRRAAEVGLVVIHVFAGRGGKAVGVAKAAKRVATHAAAASDLRCRVTQGLFCPHAPAKPSFDGRELRIGDVVVRRFRRQCKQTKLLNVCQSRGWPAFIDAPFGRPSAIDPENRLRDLVYNLNRRQVSPQRIHFWCDGGGLCWVIVGQGPMRMQSTSHPDALKGVFAGTSQIPRRPSLASLKTTRVVLRRRRSRPLQITIQ